MNKMPVRLKITLLFTAIVFIILGLTGSLVYYFTYQSRKDYIQARLSNLAVTTGRFLSRAETFNPELIHKIDSLTAIAFTQKTVMAFNEENKPVYTFIDDAAKVTRVEIPTLEEVRKKKMVYQREEERDVVLYHYTGNGANLVILTAGYDVFGHENLQDLIYILSLSLIMGLVIALISGYVFSRQLLRPISKIADEVNEISVHNLARRIETGNSRDEWYYLSDTLNKLMNRLQESFETQQRFISNASHELFTPLTAISSQLDVSLQRDREASEYRKVMESVFQDVRNMSKLTQTLLEFAKASGNPAGLEINLIRIDEILLKMPSEVAKVNPEYAVKLSFDELPQEEERLFVFGNETLLLTAIKNVVLNACKYSDNQQADIHLFIKDKSHRILIEDKGKGIPRTELSKIFQPFYRVDENRQTGGFGLGLSLAQRIIKLHKGTIDVSSEKDRGTQFTISLPAASAMVAS